MCVHLEYLKVHITCFSCVKILFIKTIRQSLLLLIYLNIIDGHSLVWGNKSLSDDKNVKILKGVKQFAAWDIKLNCLNVFTFFSYSV